MKNSMKCCKVNKKKWIYAVAVVLLILSVFLGITLGATTVDLKEMFLVFLRGDTESVAAKILLYVRLPRVLGSLLCGAALAVSGGVIQSVLANNLASPSIIGVNSGAGLAVTVCTALGLAGGWQMSAFAFAGAFLTVMTVSFGAKKWGASRGTVILMGVALNSLLGAFSDAVTTVMPEVSILRNDFRIGDFSAVTYPKLLPAAVVMGIALAVLLTLSNELDLLTLGEDTARSLGMRTGRMRVLFLLLAAALAGAAVSVAGLLSFVGLLIPHTVRRIGGSDARHLLPMSALLGAGFVTLCDTLARVIFAPYELPVGIIMAFLGAPFFLFILVKGKGGKNHA